MDRNLILLSAILYSSAVALAVFQLLKKRPPPHSALVLLLLVGFLYQSAGLYLRGMEHRSCPTGNTFEVLQFISWSSILIYLMTGPVFRLSLIGAATANIAAAMSVVSLLVPQWDSVRRSLFGGDPWIEGHASIALFSYGVFTFLAAIASLFLLQNFGLRHKKFSGFLKFLPSIYEMELVIGRLLLIALITYTSAVFIGGWYYLANPDAIKAGKLMFTLLLWTGYAAAFVLQKAGKLYHQRLAWTCIMLFVFALLTLWPVEINRAPKGEPDSNLTFPVEE
jgi:ABC-type uncharacterized transport system permease subunit